jgi:hypothetical protein
VTKLTKAEAVKIIYECAVLYNDNLLGKNVLFLTTKDDKAAAFEALFMSQNYMHLTGVKSILKSEVFFQAAYNNRLSTNDIAFASDGTTEQKMIILPRLMNIHLLARMIGDYDGLKPLLIADKFAGTVAMAMGFINVNGTYIPNTALKMDVRDITTQATRRKVAAIFVKSHRDVLYSQLTYAAKGVTVDDENLQQIINEKVDTQKLTASFPIPKKHVSG